MIYVESKRKSIETLKKKYPSSLILDVTSKGQEPWVRISPFFPHGNIPIPFSPGFFSLSVEGIWQGLKVFENSDIDRSKFGVKDMKGIKRTVKKNGRPLGHRKGVEGTELLDYITARREIYLRAYGWVLDNKALPVIEMIREEAMQRDVVLLDYDTNGDINNTKKPLSHAALVKRYMEKRYPELIVYHDESKDTASEDDLPQKMKSTQSKEAEPKSRKPRKTKNQSEGQQSLW